MNKIEYEMRKIIIRNSKIHGLVSKWVLPFNFVDDAIAAVYEDGTFIDLYVDHGCINAPAIMVEKDHVLIGAWTLNQTEQKKFGLS